MKLISSILHTKARSIYPSLCRRWNGLLLPLLLLLMSCGGSLGATPVPGELRGQWQTILTYVPVYYGGYFPNPPQGDGSIGLFFYFWPDGRYQYVMNFMRAYYGGNCFRSLRWNELGNVNIDGPNFSFRPSKATLSGMDSCGEATLKQYQPKPYTLNMTPDQDQAGWPYLRASLPSGEELLLEKCRDCK